MSNEFTKPENDVLGIDSVGTPITEGSVLLTDAQLLHPDIVTSSSLLQKHNVGIVCTKEGVQNLVETKVAMEIKPEMVFDLEALLENGADYWVAAEKVVNEVLDLDEPTPPDLEKVKALGLPKVPINDNTYICGVTREGDIVTVTFADLMHDAGDFKIDLTKGTDFVNPYDDYIGSVIEDPSGKRLLVFTNPHLDRSSLGTVTINPVERVKSKEEVMARLQEDFPWATAQDLESDYLSTFIAHDSAGYLPPVDRNRHEGLYPAVRKAEVSTASLEDLNEFESLYVAARNYMRTVEFAVWLNNLDNASALKSKDVVQTLAGELSASERLVLVLRAVDRLKTETATFVEARTLKEKALFGKTFTGPDIILDRFASKETMDLSEDFGKYTMGIVTLTGDIKRYVVRELDKVPPEERKALALRIFADILSHENGHLGYRETRTTTSMGSAKESPSKNWKYEEIWTEWKSVVYPTYLSADAIPFDSSYLHNPNTHEKGGAIAIQEMFQQLVHQVRANKIKLGGKGLFGQAITSEYVERSILATAFTRTSSGTIELDGQKILCFTDLFDLVQKRLGIEETFEGRVAGCSDEDYARKKPINMPENKPYPEAQETINALEMAYTAKVKQRFLEVANS